MLHWEVSRKLNHRKNQDYLPLTLGLTCLISIIQIKRPRLCLLPFLVNKEKKKTFGSNSQHAISISVQYYLLLSLNAKHLGLCFVLVWSLFPLSKVEATPYIPRSVFLIYFLSQGHFTLWPELLMQFLILFLVPFREAGKASHLLFKGSQLLRVGAGRALTYEQVRVFLTETVQNYLLIKSLFSSAL